MIPEEPQEQRSRKIYIHARCRRLLESGMTEANGARWRFGAVACAKSPKVDHGDNVKRFSERFMGVGWWI